MPGSKQAWPNSAACWSPAMPLIGDAVDAVDAARDDAEPARRRPHLGQRGRSGTPNRSHSSVDHASVRMSNSIVRDALDDSVACTAPPVSFHSSHESIVPNARSALDLDAALAEQPLDLRAREVRVEHEAGRVAHQRQVAGVAQLVAARRGAAVLPHDGAVQRRARRARPGDDRLALVGDADGGDRLVERGAAARASTVDDRGPDLVGVVLDPAGRGKYCGNSRYDQPAGAPCSSTAKARTPVVPASMAMTTLTAGQATRRVQSAATRR